MPAGVPPSIGRPGTWSIRASGRAARRPASTLTASSPRPAAAQGPSISPARVGERADERDAARRGGQRQGVVAVLQEHERAGGGVAGGGAPRGAAGGRLRVGAGAAAVGVVEEAEAALEREDAGHGGVDGVDGHEAAAQRLGEAAPVGERHHVDVDAGVQRQRGGLGGVGGDAVADELADGAVVAEDDAVEAPFLAQGAGEQRAAAR